MGTDDYNSIRYMYGGKAEAGQTARVVLLLLPVPIEGVEPGHFEEVVIILLFDFAAPIPGGGE